MAEFDSPAFADKAHQAAALLRALAHVARLMVLCQLTSGETSAGALQEGSGLSQSAMSQHLARLREEGLVATRREGQTIYYRVADENAEQLLEALARIYCQPKAKRRGR